MRKVIPRAGVLKALRDARGLKQSALAEELRLDTKTVWKAEKGEMALNESTVHKIATYLGTTVAAVTAAEASTERSQLGDGWTKLTLQRVSADELASQARRTATMRTFLEIPSALALADGVEGLCVDLRRALDELRATDSLGSSLEERFAALKLAQRIPLIFEALEKKNIAIASSIYLEWAAEEGQYEGRRWVEHFSASVLAMAFIPLGHASTSVDVKTGEPPDDSESDDIPW